MKLVERVSGLPFLSPHPLPNPTSQTLTPLPPIIAPIKAGAKSVPSWHLPQPRGPRPHSVSPTHPSPGSAGVPGVGTHSGTWKERASSDPTFCPQPRLCPEQDATPSCQGTPLVISSNPPVTPRGQSPSSLPQSAPRPGSHQLCPARCPRRPWSAPECSLSDLTSSLSTAPASSSER